MGSRSDPKRSWNWYSLEEKGGGVIGALGTHAFDMLNWFFGESINVSGKLATSIKKRPLPNSFDLNDVIFFQGYSGWDINQLNEEISSDSWIVLDESDLNIFKLSGKKSWGEILKKLGNKYRIWWDSPDDIYLN